MNKFPRISVVTSSYNQGQYIEQTIQSVLEQNYPHIEHIVVDGMSTDETADILARYPHLHVIREPDSGQADAINKGFRHATGSIFCFLNSDDTFLPGALLAVAALINPTAGRHIVMGRCRFIDEQGNFYGIEHPSAFESHRRVLEIWKGYAIPQPAVFWTREVWKHAGPLDEREHFLLDYDLFCRFSKHYRFHTMDQVVATYRMHNQSKTSAVDEQTRLAQAVRVSRRYWGPPTRLQYWQLQLSLMQSRLNRRRRAVDLLRLGRSKWKQHARMHGLLSMAVGTLLGPDVAADVLLMPRLRPALVRLTAKNRLIRPLAKGHNIHPLTLAWRDFNGIHDDGWVGATYHTTAEVQEGQRWLVFGATTGGFRLENPQQLEISVDGVSIGRFNLGLGPELYTRVRVPWLATGVHDITIVASITIVPQEYMGSEDYRPLAYRPENIMFSGDTSE